MDVSITSTTGSLTDALDDLNRALAKGQKQASAGVARTARKTILDEVKQGRRGGLSFSGMNASLSLSTKTQATPTAAVVTLTGKPAGAWAIVEYGTDPHDIKPKAAKALHFDGGFAARARHPGARAQKVWDRATDAADEALGRSVEDAFDQAIGAA